MTNNPNYCEHPECHNSRTVWYWQRREPHSIHTIFSFRPLIGGHRWCKSHAWINIGVMFG